MGNIRVFRRSMRHTFRNKRRFLVFLMIFAIISTMIAFYIDSLDRLNTVALLDQKGVKIEKTEGADITKTQGEALYNQIMAFDDTTEETNIEKSVIFYYADISSDIRINSIDISHPWMSDFANPSHVHTGSYPNRQNEILVEGGATQIQQITGSTVNMITDLAVGQQLEFTNGATSVELEVSGKFDTSDHKISNVNDQLWLFMDDTKFNEIVDLFGLQDSEIFTYMMTFTVEGLVLLGNTHQSVQALGDHVSELIQDTASFGDWRDVPDVLPAKTAIEEANSTIINLGFVVLGGVILSTMFAYLITRFRRREIAILKAMGYSRSSVRSALLAEILTTSFTGFVIGLLVAQSLLIFLNDFNFRTLIRLPAIGISFSIIVVVALPGMILASMRVLQVSPAEAFRDK